MACILGSNKCAEQAKSITGYDEAGVVDIGGFSFSAANTIQMPKGTPLIQTQDNILGK